MTDTDKKPLPIGLSFFDSIIERGCYYVDKTLFVRDILDSEAAVILCTRPRRFGKTLNQTMLKCFFEDTSQTSGKDTRTLFNGLKIEAAGERYMAHQGKYPVIFLSFKEAKMNTFESSYNKLRSEIAGEFKRHAYAAEKIADDEDREMFKMLRSRKAPIDDCSCALKFLCECLENYHGEKAIILIDEYDVPLENAWSSGFYDDMVNFIRPLLSSAFKDNPHLRLAVMTGCLRISRESIFTGLNNLEIMSVISKNYSEYFGFTQTEIDAILEYYGLEAKARTIRDWYNGYLFGDTEVYNPWSSVNVIKSWLTYIDEFPKPYWVNTSSNDIVRKLVDRAKADADVKTELEALMAGGTISKLIHEDITYDEIYKKADNLWNFMFFTGYLKKVGGVADPIGRQILEMDIPNKELAIIFENKVQEWFEEDVAEKNLDTFFNAILSGDTDSFQTELSKLLAESISFMDSAENFYHGFMTGVLSRMNGYAVKSNRESGSGRSDLVMYCVNGVDNRAVIFELKLAKTFDDLPSVCQDALKQIEDNNYAAYWNKEGYKSIVKYGIGFYKKMCKVLRGDDV